MWYDTYQTAPHGAPTERTPLMPKMQTPPGTAAAEPIKVPNQVPEVYPSNDDVSAPALDLDDMGFYSLDTAEDYINALYYGREGTGKTTDAAAMANLPNATRVLIINAEAGTKRRALAQRGIDTSKIVMWPAPGKKVTFAGLEALHRRLLEDLAEDPTSWTGVVFDSLTEVAVTLREQATAKRQDKLDRQMKAYDPDLIDLADYGVMTDQLSRIIRRFRDLPCHFVATALERTHDDGTVGPRMTPALADSVAGYVDFVLYVRASQDSVESADDAASEFRALTRQTRTYRAKDRFDVTPRVLANPTFDRLYAYATDALTEDTDGQQAEYLVRQTEREQALAEAKAQRAAEKAAHRASKTSRRTPTNKSAE